MTKAPVIKPITPDMIKAKTDDQLRTFLQNAKKMKNSEVIAMIESEMQSRRAFKAESSVFDVVKAVLFLVDIAKRHTTTTYGELNRFATGGGEWDWRRLRDNMQATQEVCVSNDYPSLTSLVSNRFGEFEEKAALGWLAGAHALDLYKDVYPIAEDALEAMFEARKECWEWASNLK